jgi:hypothetical protein
MCTVTKNASFLVSCAPSIANHRRKIVVPSKRSLLGLIDHEEEGTMILPKVGKYLHGDSL